MALALSEVRTELSRHAPAWLPFLVFVLALVVAAILQGGRPVYLHYFVPLADAFVHGRLDVAEHPPWLNELVPFHGRYYVVYPPMPAVVLLPFVAIAGSGFNQALLSLLMGATNAALACGIFRRMGLRGAAWVLFSLLLPLGTIHWYSVATGTSWHFAHVCAVFFLLLAIRETQLGGAPWRMGLFLGAAALSRLPCLMSWPFFVAYLAWKSHAPDGGFGDLDQPMGWRWPAWGRFWRLLVPFGLALGFCVGLYLAYNSARFGSPWQTGYSLIPGLLQEYQYRFGFFSVHSIPRNLFAMLFKPPNLVEAFPFFQPPILGGLSLALTTPIFAWTLRAHGRNLMEAGAWAAIGLVLVPILMHADPGGEQFGYRYAQDFYPFLMLLAARGVGHRVGFEAGLAFALAFLVNAWGMWATFVGFRS